MHFIKKHQKAIAVVAAFTFFYLIHVTALPVHAKPQPINNNGHNTISSDESTPGLIEQRPSSEYKFSKKSPLIPIIIAVVVAGAIAAVLILVVFKTKYDIVGTWRVNLTWDGGGSSSLDYIFRSDKKAGDVLIIIGASTVQVGKYTVDGKNVEFDFLINHFTGHFTAKDTMEGTNRNTLNETGQWKATKISSSTQSTSTDQTREQLEKHVRKEK